MSTLPLHPKNPERVCWGCDKYCPAESLACGNGTIRAPHPAELFGDDWLDFVAERESGGAAARQPAPTAGTKTPGTTSP